MHNTYLPIQKDRYQCGAYICHYNGRGVPHTDGIGVTIAMAQSCQ